MEWISKTIKFEPHCISYEWSLRFIPFEWWYVYYILPSNQHVFLVILPLYSVLTVFGDVLGVLLMSWWWRCSRMVSSWYWRNGIFWLSWLTCQYQIGVKGMKREALLLGLYAGLILIDRPNILAGEMLFLANEIHFWAAQTPKKIGKIILLDGDISKIPHELHELSLFAPSPRPRRRRFHIRQVGTRAAAHQRGSWQRRLRACHGGSRGGGAPGELELLETSPGSTLPGFWWYLIPKVGILMWPWVSRRCF